MKNLSTIFLAVLITTNLYWGFKKDVIICQIIAYILFIGSSILTYVPIMLSDMFYHSYLKSLRKLPNLSILISISLSALTLSFVYGYVIFYFMLINTVYLHLLILVAKTKKNLDA